MTRTRVERSDVPIYLCSQRGPRIANSASRDEIVHTVHSSEMTADLAAAFGEELERIAQQGLLRRPPDQISDTPNHQVVTLLVPADEIPDGKPVHLEYSGGIFTATYDETKIKPELAARLGALGEEISKYHYYAPDPNASDSPTEHQRGADTE